MLYKLIFNGEKYLNFFFDRKQISRILGERTISNKEKFINYNHCPRSYVGVFDESLNFDFSSSDKEDKGKPIPDIVVASGRLFLSQKAYDVLYPLIKNDGEFLSVNYQKGEGYFFIPLQVADVDKKVTMKNEWEDIVSLGFSEDDVKEFSVFRTEYDAFIGLYCQDYIKDAIEQAGLTGLFITNDLANIFAEDRSAVSKLN
ncbi:hypothetical protein [Aliikangiella sp. IMCC44359]|uniref:hypothetical protein n=1 Tax=Aliikangiella sp. IMCC44359 TaxID=3459125 RepID=UPI00403ADE32